jgi:hypothetical protein
VRCQRDTVVPRAVFSSEKFWEKNARVPAGEDFLLTG